MSINDVIVESQLILLLLALSTKSHCIYLIFSKIGQFHKMLNFIVANVVGILKLILVLQISYKNQ
jgi:hypothetical protein